MNNSKVAKNASWIIACKIAQSVLALVIGSISSRYLGPSNYGLINYAASLVAFVVPIVQLGFRNTLVEELTSNPEKEGQTMGTALWLTVLSSFAGIAGIISFVYINNAGEKETLFVCALHSIGLIFQMTELIVYWFQAKLKSKYTSVVSLSAYAIVSAYRIFLLATKKSIYWFSVATAFDYMIISVALIIIYYKLGDQGLRFSFTRAKEMFAKSRYYILSGMMITIFSQTDKIMLKSMINDAENGFYTAAVACSGMASFVFQAIIDSFRPVIFSFQKKNKEAYEKNMKRLYSVIIYLGIAQSVFFAVFAKIAILILNGKDYLSAVPVLRVITWSSTFSYIGSVRNVWILAEKKQKYLPFVNLSGAVLNVAGNFILIPLYGALGAAMATVATQFFTNFILSFAFKPIKGSGKLLVQALNPKILIDMIPKRRTK